MSKHLYPSLGQFDPTSQLAQSIIDVRPNAEELNAAYQHIDELKASLAEMVAIYWGDGDGHEPPPICIQRAQALLAEEVIS